MESKVEKAEQEYCGRCPQKSDCGYMSRGLTDKCVQLQDYMDGYERGKEEAIKKAVAWIKEHKEAVETEDNGIMGWIPDYFIEDFKKALEEE